MIKISKDVDFKSLGFPTKETYEFPNIINIEVYRGACPCECVHCPVGTTEPSEREKRFGKKSMDMGLYEKIIEEISAHPSSALRVHSVGDPLLWKNLADALKLAHDKSVKSWLFTSAITNDMPLLEAICKNTGIIEVSVNSIDVEDYKATKGIAAFSKAIENIQYMHNFIADNKIPARLIVSRVQSLNRSIDEEFVRYWKSSGLVHDAFVRSYHTYNDLMAELPLEKEKQTHQPCLVHWARFNISVDGYAVICFNELFKKHLDSSLILGNINKQTIAQIWHGHELSALRKAELRGDYSSLLFSNSLPCKDCYSCQPLYTSRQTSEYQIKQL